jgi:prevent-host-death family protein
MTSAIGARELRRDLAAHVRRAAAGERLVVTVGGRPTAMLGPVEGGAADVTLDSLVAAGAVVPPRRRGAARLADPISVWSGVRLDKAFREVRG